MKQGCNLSKFKRSDVGGIQAEQKRLYKDKTKYNNDVNIELSKNNVIIDFQDEKNWVKCATKKIKKHQEITNKKIRKDAVIFCSMVETVPASWNKKICDEYFKKQHEVKFDLLKKYGLDKNVKLSSITHYDETNPHHTDTFMPIKDNKFNFNGICSKAFYRELGKELWKSYLEFERTHELPELLEEPDWNNGRKRKNEMKYKADQLEKDIKQKIEQSEAIDKDTEIKSTKLNSLNDEIKRLSVESIRLSMKNEDLAFDKKKYEEDIELLEFNKNRLEDEIETKKDELDILKDMNEYQQEFNHAQKLLERIRDAFDRFYDKLTYFNFKREKERLFEVLESSLDKFTQSVEKLLKFEILNDIDDDKRLSRKLDLDKQIEKSSVISKNLEQSKTARKTYKKKENGYER